MRARSDCAALVARGSIRINRQPTDKPHARLRVGDVLTVPVHRSVRVVARAGAGRAARSAPEARMLYEEISERRQRTLRVSAFVGISPPLTAARGLNMTYVVTETCIRCKYMDCVEVCPVDCFYVGANMLVIHPDECIDCGVCEPECPVEAIVPDSDDKAGDWLEQNRTYAALWPNITRKGEPPADADEWKDKPDKAKLFDPEPGKP